MRVPIPSANLPEHIKQRGTLFKMTRDEHMARSREILEDARTEPNGDLALCLMQASQQHVFHAEYLEGLDDE